MANRGPFRILFAILLALSFSSGEAHGNEDCADRIVETGQPGGGSTPPHGGFGRPTVPPKTGSRR